MQSGARLPPSTTPRCGPGRGDGCGAGWGRSRAMDGATGASAPRQEFSSSPPSPYSLCFPLPGSQLLAARFLSSPCLSFWVYSRRSQLADELSRWGTQHKEMSHPVTQTVRCCYSSPGNFAQALWEWVLCFCPLLPPRAAARRRGDAGTAQEGPGQVPSAAGPATKQPWGWRCWHPCCELPPPKKKSKKVELRREKPHLVLLHFARLLAVTSAEQRLELLVFYFNLCTAPGLAEVWQPGEGFLRLRGRVCSRAASHMGAGQGLILRTHGSVGLARPRSAPRAPCASHGPERVEVGVWWPRVAPYPLPGTAPSHA